MNTWNGLTEKAILERIESGETIMAIAESVGRSRSRLTEWLDGNPERSARAANSRRKAAAAWDDLAEAKLSRAADPFDLAKARDLAHHYRWRSSRIDPAMYGDKQQVEHTGKLTLEQLVADTGNTSAE